jgi:hypothetical protein
LTEFIRKRPQTVDQAQSFVNREDNMRKLLVIGFIGLILIAGLLFTHKSTTAQTAPSMPTPQAGPAGSIDLNPSSPDALTSFIVSNPYCYQPDPNADQCYINFRYIQANDNQTSAPYLTWLTIKISDKTRYSATAFFEGTIYYGYDMAPGGLKVACGAPNAGGAGDQYGSVYGVVITPLDSSRDPMSTDIANVTCPAYAP